MGYFHLYLVSGYKNLVLKMEKKKNFSKLEEILIYIVLILAIASLIFGFYTILKPNSNQSLQHIAESKMGMTSFDKELCLLVAIL